MLDNLPDLSYSIETEKEFQETQKIVKYSIANNDVKSLEKHIQKRIRKFEYIESLLLRGELQEDLEQLNENIKIANGTEKGPDGKKTTCYVKVREYSLKYREIFESLALLNKRIDEYRLNTAYAAHSLSTLKDRLYGSNVIAEYVSQSFGNWVESEKHKFGSEEWKQQQSDGLGGTDIYRALKVDPKNGAAHQRELKLRKLGLEDDKEFVETTAIHIGNSWEKNILYMYAENHPDKNISISKTLWKGQGIKSFYRAKFDGVELDENSYPISIIEIKTGTASEDWADVSYGINGIPPKYKYQILWYAKNTGVKTAVLVALLDDHDYREYHIDLTTSEIEKEWKNAVKGVHEFWAMILERRAELEQGINKVKRPTRKGFPKSALVKSGIDKETEKIAAYTDQEYSSIFPSVNHQLSFLKELGKQGEKKVQNALTKFYAEHNPELRNRPLIGIDIETNGLSPKESRIIETGVVMLYPDGDSSIVFSSVHDIPEIAKEGIGIGETSVHRIELDTIKGKPSFDSPEIQKKILEYLLSGVIVAHNATFEKGFLIVNLPGFAEELDAGNIKILDTMNLIANLMLETPDNRLQSFAEYNGIPYEGAHNATTDTYMMMKALRNFQQTLFTYKKFVPRIADDNERKQAIELGKEIDNAR